MKFRVTFKTPGAVTDAAVEAASASRLRHEVEVKRLTEDERREMKDDLVNKAQRVASKFVKWGEYVTIEFDTEAGTAVVLPAGG